MKIIQLLCYWLLFCWTIAVDNNKTAASTPKKPTKPYCQKKQMRFNRGMDLISWQQQDTLCKMLKNYKNTIRATNKEQGATFVYTHLDITSIGALHEAQMQFKVQFRFLQKWFDSRLEFTHKRRGTPFEYIPIAHDQIIWTPDTFFQNEKSGYTHLIDKPNYSVRVRHDGLVEYDRRLTMTFACLMDFKRYPHDTQECEMDFASYAYTTKDIEYVWEDEPITFQPQALDFMLKFYLASYANLSCTSSTNTGTYSCLRLQLRFARNFSHFFLKLYSPSIMLVGVSYIGYWIDWKSAPGRVPLAMLTILGTIVQANIINSNLPPVSYIKAIDIWITTCLCLAFSSLIEYAFVNYMGVKDNRRKAKATALSKAGELSAVIAQTACSKSPTPTAPPLPPTVTSAPDSSTKDTTDKITEVRPNTVSSPQHQPSDCLPEGVLLVHPVRLMSDDIDRKISTPTAVPAPALVKDINAYFRQRRREEVGIEEMPPPMILRTRRQLNVIQLFSRFKTKTRAERVDFGARIMLPLVFIGFNIVYWNTIW